MEMLAIIARVAQVDSYSWLSDHRGHADHGWKCRHQIFDKWHGIMFKGLTPEDFRL